MVRQETLEYNGPKVAVIGGGTGPYTTMSALKPYVWDGLTGIPGMVDDGGSTGVLRDRFGTLPYGDIRQHLEALSDVPEATRRMFNRRDPRIVLEGSEEEGPPCFGNIMLLEAEQEAGDVRGGVQLVSQMMNLRGRVTPITYDNRRLVITTKDGEIIRGEHTAEKTNIPSLRGARVGFDIEPTTIDPEAEAAIAESDLTIIAPGDLYTSIGPALAVRGTREALKKAGRVLYATNLMNRARHTVGFRVHDYAEEIERWTGPDVLDYVLYNTEVPKEAYLKQYLKEGERLVEVDQAELKRARYKAVGRELVSYAGVVIDEHDRINDSRSLIRHDLQKYGYGLMDILNGEAA